MADKRNETNDSVTLEDLLKVKRVERPNQAFWGKFDRELHQKMLQTLVKKDPWYAQVMRGLTGRIAQTATVAGLAGLAVMIVARTGDGDSGAPAAQLASVQQDTSMLVMTPGVSPQASLDLGGASLSTLASEAFEADVRDYHLGSIASNDSIESPGLAHDFAMESLHASNYDSYAYSGDAASVSLSFVTPSVASLVY